MIASHISPAGARTSRGGKEVTSASASAGASRPSRRAAKYVSAFFGMGLTSPDWSKCHTGWKPGTIKLLVVQIFDVRERNITEEGARLKLESCSRRRLSPWSSAMLTATFSVLRTPAASRRRGNPMPSSLLV
jgi:hypothetical protein